MTSVIYVRYNSHMNEFTSRDIQELCTVKQVVEMTKVSRQAVHQAIRNGRLRVKYLGHHPYPYRTDAELWAASRVGVVKRRVSIVRVKQAKNKDK